MGKLQPYRLAHQLLVMVALLDPSLCLASGVAQDLPLADAVKQAREILLVEQAQPPMRKVQKNHPYKDPKTKQPKTLTTERTLFRFKVLKRLAGAEKNGPRPGKVIEVIDTNTLLGESVHVSMVTTGTWPIPIFPQLKGQVEPSPGKRFLLLLSGYNTQEQVYQGVGGLGLLPAKSKGEVLRLHKKTAPPLRR